MIARREIPAETRAQQNIFISMTDLTVSALLVIVILMAFMATQMRDTRSLKKLADLRSQLNATQSAFSELQAENVEQGQLINQLSQDLSAQADIRTELDETIKKLEQSVVQRSVEISRLDLELRAALQTAGLAQSRLLASQAARAADQEKAETELEFARQRGEALTKRIEEYEKNNKNLGATLAKVNTKYQDLQNEFDRQIAAAERTKLELEVKIEDLQARTLELTDNLEKSAERLAAGERTLAAEKLRLDNSRAELAAVRNSLSIELKTSRELNKDHAQTKILLNSSQSEIEILNKKILELAGLLDAEKASKIYAADLRSEIEGLNKKLSDERLKLQVSEGQSKTLNGIVDELRGALVKEQEKVAGLEQLLGDAQADLEEYEKNNKNLGATLAKVNTKYQDLQNEFDRQIAAAERTKLELEVKIEDLQARTLELTDNLEKSAERLAAGERTLAAEKLRLDNSRAELAAVRNSLSIELKTSRELNKDHAQTKILLNSSQSEIEILNKKILELAGLLDAEKASKIYAADLRSEIEGLNKKLSDERLKLQVSEGQSKTLNGIVDELRGALVKEQKKVAGLEQLLGDAQADLDAKKLGFAQRDGEISQLRAELINEQSNYSEKLEDLGNQIARLELDIAAAEQKSKISNNQATALVGTTNELRAALKAAQGTANTLRDNAAQFDRQLASALSIDTPDRQIIMERISVLAQDEPSTAPNPESLRTELAGAMLEVEMLSKQNANLKATIQTLLANSSKIIERLRNK